MKLDDSIDSCVQRVSAATMIIAVATSAAFVVIIIITSQQAFDLALHQWEEKPKNLSEISQVPATNLLFQLMLIPAERAAYHYTIIYLTLIPLYT